MNNTKHNIKLTVKKPRKMKTKNIAKMTTLENEVLSREMFAFDVSINLSKFFAKWSNNFHPENPNFMQSVNWFAYLSGDGSKLIVSYCLDKQITYPITHEIIDFTGDFTDMVYSTWKEQTL